MAELRTAHAGPIAAATGDAATAHKYWNRSISTRSTSVPAGQGLLTRLLHRHDRNLGTL